MVTTATDLLAPTGYRAVMLVARMAPFTSTIFAEMSALAVRLEFRSLLAGREWCQGWRPGPA